MHVESWKKCLLYIRERIPAQSFSTWFEPIVPHRLQNGVLTIHTESIFLRMVGRKLCPFVKTGYQSEIGENGRLEYSVVVDKGDDHKQPMINVSGQVIASTKTELTAMMHTKTHIKRIKEQFEPNPSYRFENFIEGDCNRLARSGLCSGQKPERPFNPLMFYGGVGLGIWSSYWKSNY